MDYGYDFNNDGFLRNAGAILSFKLFDLKVRDLCQFIKSSLAKACEDYGIPAELSKKSFDHSKIFGWESVAEHKSEVLHYLEYDVRSLCELFKTFQNEMFSCFKQDVNSCVSISQFGYKAWASTFPKMSEIYIPHAGKEEDDDRAAYYGGRVGVQRREYESSQFVEKQLEYTYNDIEDYLVIGDVNSLYPHVQRKFHYAYGKWRYWNGDELALLNQDINGIMNEVSDEDWMLRSCFQVNVSCPKDLLTPFLVKRGKKGNLKHRLKDLKAQWYWGCELIEAIFLGYRITEVLDVKEFEKRGNLFEPFIDTCWEGRQKFKKPNIKNTIYKLVMNATTGKFGQKTHPTVTSLFNCTKQDTPETRKSFTHKVKSATGFDFVIDSEGSACALLLESSAEDSHPPYPIYLSAQILAYSRVYMSSLYRLCNAYLDPARAIYYTDTDSLVLPKDCVPDLMKANVIGKNLGQLGCDLYDAFVENRFAKILKGVWAAPKGPYSLVYVLPNSPEPLEKIRTKGIRHPEGPFKLHESSRLKMTSEVFLNAMHALQWTEDPVMKEVPNNFIHEKLFVWEDEETGETYFCSRMNWHHIQRMIYRKGILTSYYGGMKKIFFNNNNDKFLGITPIVSCRTACKTDWWAERSGRLFIDPEDPYTISVPLGYEPKRNVFEMDLFNHLKTIV